MGDNGFDTSAKSLRVRLCEERSDEAIQENAVIIRLLDCFADARNDGAEVFGTTSLGQSAKSSITRKIAIVSALAYW